MSQFNFKESNIADLFSMRCQQSFDLRGCFVKIFNAPIFKKHGLDFSFRESFYTVSKKNVIRGMHFQVSPFDGFKMVTLISGHIIDVVLDLRRESKSYGKYHVFDLHAENAEAILIPPSCAHGFLTLEDNSILSYCTEFEYSPEHDSGILYDSFGFNWPCYEPIVSDRDKKHPTFSEYIEKSHFL